MTNFFRVSPGEAPAWGKAMKLTIEEKTVEEQERFHGGMKAQ